MLKGHEILVGADGRRDGGTLLLVQRVVNNGAVLQGHLRLDNNNGEIIHY